MRAVVLVLALWAGSTVAEDKPFTYKSLIGESVPAIAKGLKTWVKDRTVHGFAEVHGRGKDGEPFVITYHFTGCESGHGTVFEVGHYKLTEEPFGLEVNWNKSHTGFPSLIIAPLCEIAKPQWQPLLTKK